MRAITPRDGPHYLLLLFFARFLAASFAGQRFFHALFLARFQVEGMTLHFLDDVFLLYLAFETSQRILEGLALLNSDFSQTNYTPLLVPNWTTLVMSSTGAQSQAECQKICINTQKLMRNANCTRLGAYDRVAAMKSVRC